METKKRRALRDPFSRPRHNTTLGNLRPLSGISQAELAEIAGVSRQTIIELEAGHRGPRLITAAAITRALGYEKDVAVVFPEYFTGD